MIIQAVVIADEKNGIGKKGELLAYMPADLRHFKELTTGYPVIMGRRTFDSIKKPLPGRRNIIVSRKELSIENCEVVHSIADGLALCAGAGKVSIVGGAIIYEQSLHLVNIIYLTRIHHTFDADAFFPAIDPATWKETERADFLPDEKNPYPWSFITFERR